MARISASKIIMNMMAMTTEMIIMTMLTKKIMMSKNIEVMMTMMTSPSLNKKRAADGITIGKDICE